LAAVSGAAAPLFIEHLRAVVAGPAAVAGVEVMGPSDDVWLVRAPDHDALLGALGSVARPPGRLRIAVDPLRL
jgi:primosomal protein N' (replication factor Y)